METRTIREQAQALRAGVIGGFVSITDVVRWADVLVGEDRGLDAPQLFDLALLRPGDVARAVSLLGDVPGEWHPGSVGREIAALLHRRLANGELTERQAARALYVAMREGLAPDREFENMAYHFDDGVDLAVQGMWGNLADIRAEMLDYLARFSRPAA